MSPTGYKRPGARAPSDADLLRWEKFLAACEAVRQDPTGQVVGRKLADARRRTCGRPMPKHLYFSTSPLYRLWTLTVEWSALPEAEQIARAATFADLADGLELEPSRSRKLPGVD